METKSEQRRIWTWVSPDGKGENLIKLVPDQATAGRVRAMGRDPNTFYIHADNGARNQSASQGCIIMDGNERQAIRQLQGAKIRVVP